MTFLRGLASVFILLVVDFFLTALLVMVFWSLGMNGHSPIVTVFIKPLSYILISAPTIIATYMAYQNYVGEGKKKSDNRNVGIILVFFTAVVATYLFYHVLMNFDVGWNTQISYIKMVLIVAMPFIYSIKWQK